MNKQIIRFPKDGQVSLAANEWQVWDGEGDEGAPFNTPDLKNALNNIGILMMAAAMTAPPMKRHQHLIETML